MTAYNSNLTMQLYNSKFQEDYNEKAIMESSVLRIQGLEIALERAIEDISLLQKNLAYVIDLKEELSAEIKVREKREESLMREFQKELSKRDSEIEMLKSEREDIAELLSDTKQALSNREAMMMQREEEKRRFERIIEDQRATIQVLEEQLLAAKYSSDLSYQSISFDNTKIQQLERENDNLRFQLGKLKAASERESLKCKKQQKQIQTFKSWLGSVLGVKKVVEGCESVLMQEIENRLNHGIKI